MFVLTVVAFVSTIVVDRLISFIAFVPTIVAFVLTIVAFVSTIVVDRLISFDVAECGFIGLDGCGPFKFQQFIDLIRV